MTNSISVVIPCYNEWTRVGELVYHVLSIFQHEVQVIISDQSNDQIIFHSLKHYKDNQNIIYTKSTGDCRAETMNHGASLASWDILLFLHADNQLPIQANTELKHIDLSHYIWWWFLKLYSPFTFWTNMMTTFWNIKRVRSKQFFGDNAMWCSKKVFEELWWFPRMKLFEDVAFSKTLLDYTKWNNKDIYVSLYPTITSSRKYSQWWFRRVFWLQTKLQILYKLGLYNDNFQQKYYQPTVQKNKKESK